MGADSQEEDALIVSGCIFSEGWRHSKVERLCCNRQVLAKRAGYSLRNEMEHIQEGRFIENLWDGIALTDDERSHLSLCSACQERLSEFATLRQTFLRNILADLVKNRE